MEEVELDDVLAWIRGMAAVMEENRAFLTELDSAIGDADHGINMNRGFKAVMERLESSPPDDVPGALRTVAMALIGKVGGAAGPLYGTMFMEMGRSLTDREAIDPDSFVQAFRAGIDGVKARGKAVPGDKTMIDALEPAHAAMAEAVASGADLGEALARGAAAARDGMEATIPMVARKGRASYLGERSAGHQDPGATSSHLIVAAAAEVWER